MADSANNDTVLTANDLGTITSSLEFSGVLNAGIGDREDYYIFTLAENSSVAIATTGTNGLGQDLFVDLNNNGFYERGETITSTTRSSGFLSADLPAGTYYLLFTESTENQYDTRIAVTPNPSNLPRDPGSSLDDNPLNLGVLSGRRIIRDYVGGLDPYDYYQFQLAETSNLSVRMTSNSFSTDIRIISDNNANGILDSGEVVESSGGTDTSFTEFLEAGTYFLQVERDTSFFSNGSFYEVTLAPAPDRSGDDVIRGTARIDRINGQAGNDRIFGLGGNDVLVGAAGNDILVGGPGNDRLVGGTGSDLLRGGEGRDIAILNEL